VIPRTLHHIWFGPRPVPEAWIAAWCAMHPGWEHRLWREADLAGVPMVNRAAFEDFLARGVWHGAADIARVAILRAQGGVYVDVDSKPLRPFTGAPFMDAGFFAAYEPSPSLPGRIANGTIGAEAGHPILATYAELVSRMECLAEPWDTTGGTGLTAAVLVHRQCCKPLVLPARTFYATDAHGRPVPGRETAYSEHFWASTNHAYPVRAAIMVPRRAGDLVRDRSWEYVRRHWEPLGLPIHEGHHDDGPFNAAAARNAAAESAGDWEVAVFADADTVMVDHEPVRRAIAQAAKTGQMVRPYARYWILDQGASEALMSTGRAPRSTGARLLRAGQAHGGVNVVPRALWDKVGGYDERFRGWGSEDTAFELACTVLGGFRQTQGDVYHLWHPISADRSTADPGFQANVALRHRYEAARRPGAMRALVAEHDGREPAPPEVGLVIMTNGRRDCIARTIPSLEAQVGPFAQRVICDDSGDPAYVAWLRETFPAFTIRAHPHLGHGGAVRFAMAEAAKLDADWVFWSEDDFEFACRIDVPAMVRTMETEGDDLKQMVIRRQAWFPAEVEAGGMIERFDPALFTEREGPCGPWIEHRQFFSLNPHLIRRSLLSVIRWPAVENSEHHFGLRLFRDARVRCGIWGAKADAPIARHSGERVGTGY
jgi:hypothetical protein